MTKKEAAMQLLFLAKGMKERSGDDDIDRWIYQIDSIVRGLDKEIAQSDRYWNVFIEDSFKDSKKAKLMRLILHPETPWTEREAAVLSLDRIRKKEEADNAT